MTGPDSNSWPADPRPICIDYFAGEGGAGMGYFRAGYDVFAVDNDAKRLALNPFPSHLGDALQVAARFAAGDAIDFTYPNGRVRLVTLAEVDLNHGSPTCTGYSQGTVALPNRLARYDRLIAVTREAFIMLDKPYVIENVYGARNELVDPIMLCARQFGLRTIDTDGTPLLFDRHRMFESNMPIVAPEHRKHDNKTPLAGAVECRCGKVHVQVAGLYSGARRDKYDARHVRHGGYVPPSLGVIRALTGASWMSEQGCFLSIPPAFSSYVGAQILALTDDPWASLGAVA